LLFKVTFFFLILSLFVTSK